MAKPTRRATICSLPHPQCVERFRRIEGRVGHLERDKKWLSTSLAKLADSMLYLREKSTIMSQRSEKVEEDIRGILRRLNSGAVVMLPPGEGDSA